MKAKWILDKALLEHTSQENLPHILKDLGYDCKIMQYIPFNNIDDYELPYPYDDCVIVYGTIELVRKLPYYGIYLNQERLKFSTYYANLKLSSKYYLNADFIMAPFFDIKTNFDKYTKIFNSDALFIRPNSGSKLFTGMSISYSNFEYEINSLEHLSGVSDESLIIISKEKRIYDEVRFIVIGNEIVDGSRYKSNMKKKEDKIFDPAMRQLAEIVASCKDVPEDLYTVDIAMTDDGPKIIELNSFSSAGWYACDAKTIIHKASKYIENKFKEEIKNERNGI